MARIFIEERYNAKRNEILDFAARLVYSKGYEQMTTQDLLDGLHISRGAFYHYFDSKEALLEALVERMGKAATETIQPILQDPDLPAIQKFQKYFEASARWKSGQKELIIGLVRSWYSDGNTLIRQRLSEKSLVQTPLILEPMIRQGIREGVFTTRFPVQAAQFITGLALTFSDTIMRRVLTPQADQAALLESEIVLNTNFEAYFDTIERILGAPSGSLKGIGGEALKDWLVVSPQEPASL
ncbi:MAG TPA: TetR/AcrR family transcriptional regulator [Anaerolineaceae bacterium]|jgi:AcrR family transcriptional regulator